VSSPGTGLSPVSERFRRVFPFDLNAEAGLQVLDRRGQGPFNDDPAARLSEDDGAAEGHRRPGLDR
jgi:hypothetical protein